MGAAHDSDMTNTTHSELIARRDAAAAAYYEGEALMDDVDFDALTAQLTALGVEETVGHGYVPAGKVKHVTRMLSLTKIQADEEDGVPHALADLEKFVAATNAPSYVAELKYDGNAVTLTYVDGELKSGVTRGNGTFGESVDYALGLMADAGTLPRTIDGAPGTLILRGEVMFSLVTFKEFNATLEDPYKNARGAAAGIVRRNKGDQAQHLSLVIHDDAGIVPEQLRAWGFVSTTQHFSTGVAGVNPDIGRGPAEVAHDLRITVDKVDSIRGSLDFETDGVVIKVEDRQIRARLGDSSTAPRWAVAWKFNSPVHEVVVTGLEWQLGRTGKLTPVIVYTPPVVPGWTNDRATGHNFEQVESLDPRVGDTLRMKRSGEVIPFIMGKSETAARGPEPLVFPTEFLAPDGVVYPVIRKGVNLVVDGYLNPVQLIVYGLGMLGVKGVSDSIVKKLVDAGVVATLPDMLDVTIDDVAQFSGEGKGSGKVVVDAIADALRGATVVQWFASIGLPHMALTTGTVLANAFTTLDGIAAATEDKLVGLDKFGPIKTANFLANQHKVAELSAALAERDYTPLELEPIVAVASEYSGLHIVLTGKFPTLGRPAATDYAKRMGAIVQSGVNGKTDIVIAGEDAGSKLAKGQAVGARIISATDFEDEIAASGA